MIASKEENPVLISAMFQRDAATHEVEVIRGELLPTMSLEGSYQREYESSPLIDRQDDGSVELRLSMPLYNAGTTYSRIRQARAVLQQREHDVQDVANRIKASTISSWQQRRAAAVRITAAQKSVSAAKSAVKGMKLQSEVGERSIFELLDAQRDLVDAQVELAQAERDMTVAGFRLLSSVGGLTVDRLQLHVAHYDVYENLDAVRYQPIGGVSGGLIQRAEDAQPDVDSRTGRCL